MVSQCIALTPTWGIWTNSRRNGWSGKESFFYKHLFRSVFWSEVFNRTNKLVRIRNCCWVWRIYSNVWTFKYFWSEYLFGYSFASFFGYKYIRIFIHVNFLDTNIFGYSFVSFSWHEYIRIFVRIKIHMNVTLCFAISVDFCILPLIRC